MVTVHKRSLQLILILALVMSQFWTNATSVLAGLKQLDPWQYRAAIPITAINNSAVGGIDGKVYVFGGNVQEYDPSVDQWTTRSGIPTPRSLNAAFSYRNGLIYLAGGVTYGCFCVLDRLDAYNVADDSWTTLASMPEPRLGLGLVGANNGKLFAIGGKNATDTPVSTVFVYDIRNDSWSTGANMPYPNAYFGIANASNGKIYIFGGETNPTGILEYDPDQDTWAIVGAMPTPRSVVSAVSAENGMIFVAGGYSTGGQLTASVEGYDPIKKTWTGQPDMILPKASFGFAAANRTLYAVGGLGQTNAGLVALNTLETAEITRQPASPPIGYKTFPSEKWETVTSLPTPTYNMSAAVSNGKIYVEGGDVAFGQIQEFNPASQTWTTYPLGTPRWLSGSATDPGGLIYLMGGSQPGCTTCLISSVETFDPLTHAVAYKASMPTPRMGLGVVTAADGRIYAMGGRNQFDNPTNVVEVYDPSTNTWSSRSPMPIVNSYFALAAANNGKIYMFGGSNFASGTLEYDPGTDAWVFKSNLPTARNVLSAAGATNGRIYVIGGYNLSGQITTVVEEYDPVVDSWATKISMPTARASLVSVYLDGAVYAIGGFGRINRFSFGGLRTVERLKLEPELIGIDIVPGSGKNNISLTSRGNIDVAILSTPSFNAPTMINQTTIAFGKTGFEDSMNTCVVSDVNGDSIPDLVCSFAVPKTGFVCDSTAGILQAISTTGQKVYKGIDLVSITACK